MTKLRSLLVLLVVLFSVSCNMSAKNEKNSDEATTAAKGEVVLLDKAEFLTKVFDYETNTTEWIYEGDKPCIIDFYADWCGPCKKVAPVLKELAKEYENDIIVYKVDVDKEKDLAMAFGIQSIPTLLFVPAKGTPMVSMGALSKDQFVQQINDFLLPQK
ncbi:MAG: thioredoxin [Tannerellaceae bacterium]|nr:thioredoxin [Tannerellaceae bacterium]